MPPPRGTAFIDAFGSLRGDVRPGLFGLIPSMEPIPGLDLTTVLGLSDAVFGAAAGLLFVGHRWLDVPKTFAAERFGSSRWIARTGVWDAPAVRMTFVAARPLPCRRPRLRSRCVGA